MSRSVPESPVSLRSVAWTALLTALSFTPAAAAAQKLEKVSTPIDVTASPPLALVGSEIELAGSSVVLRDAKTVTIAVRSPQGQQATLAAELDESGRYTKRIRAVELGTYQVTAIAPDGKARAQATFTTASPAAVGEHAAAAARELLDAGRKSVAKLVAAAARAPASPPREELVTRLGQLEQRLADAPARLDELELVIADVDSILAGHPATTPEFEPLFDALAEVSAQADPLAAQLEERVRQIEVGITDCDRLDMVGEAVGFLGLAVSLVGRPISVAANLLADKTFSTRLSARDPRLAGNAEAKLAVDSAVKHSVGIAQGLDSWRGGVYSYVNDLVQFAAQKVFGAYCEKFEGPFEGTFHLEYYEGSEKWLAYDVALKGMLFLRYEKGSTPAQVRGEFEGVADFPSLWENFLVVERWAKPYTIARWARRPTLLGDVYLPEAGKLGRATLGMLRVNPGYFYVPVEGLVQGDKLSIKFLEANQDYPERAKGKVIYVLVEPSLPIPQVAKLEVTYQGAHYILSRATHQGRGTAQEPFTLPIEIDTKRKISFVDKSYTRREEEPGNFLLQWTLHLRTCNPGCPY